MLAFGIDPGSRKLGWGAVRVEGSKLTCVDYGIIRLDEKAPLHERLSVIFDELTERMDRVDPERIFLESMFFQKSAQSALVLGQARGVALLVAARSQKPVGEVSPAEVKKAVTGSGRATKAQVQQMVQILLGIKDAVPSDAADALSVAIAGSAAAKWNDMRDALGAPKPNPRGRKTGWRR